MKPVADLVSAVFADELDGPGRAAMREMQWAAWFSPVLGDLLSLLLFDDFVYGYVWLEKGRVVGNVTFQRADALGTRWRISNVAVRPEYRRRGIAAALMRPALNNIAEQGGDWAILHVRGDNSAALHLYESLGFHAIARAGVWRLPAPPAQPPSDPGAPLVRLRPTDWMPRLELAHASHPALAQWIEPISAETHRLGLGWLLAEGLGRLAGLYRVERWGVWDSVPAGETPVLAGAVEIFAGAALNDYRLRLAVRPSARGRLEVALVARALTTLSGLPPRPILVEHSGDHTAGVAALEAAGFRPERVLVTMRRATGPGHGV
jgi:ribosomal protein S18 acetylase RimI-like enzyme